MGEREKTQKNCERVSRTIYSMCWWGVCVGVWNKFWWRVVKFWKTLPKCVSSQLYEHKERKKGLWVNWKILIKLLEGREGGVWYIKKNYVARPIGRRHSSGGLVSRVLKTIILPRNDITNPRIGGRKYCTIQPVLWPFFREPGRRERKRKKIERKIDKK